jgi:hypothetical protein
MTESGPDGHFLIASSRHRGGMRVLERVSGEEVCTLDAFTRISSSSRRFEESFGFAARNKMRTRSGIENSWTGSETIRNRDLWPLTMN